MPARRPLGAVLAGWLLGSNDPLPTIVVMASVIAIPGALGLALPALGPEATGEAGGSADRISPGSASSE